MHFFNIFHIKSNNVVCFYRLCNCIIGYWPYLSKVAVLLGGDDVAHINNSAELSAGLV